MHSTLCRLMNASLPHSITFSSYCLFFSPLPKTENAVKYSGLKEVFRPLLSAKVKKDYSFQIMVLVVGTAVHLTK